MGKKLERFGEAEIINAMNSFGLDFVENLGSGFRSTTPNMGGVL